MLVCVVLGVDNGICCQVVGSASGEAACQRAVSGVFKGIPDKYWGILLRVGDPEIILSVIKLRNASWFRGVT